MNTKNLIFTRIAIVGSFVLCLTAVQLHSASAYLPPDAVFPGITGSGSQTGTGVTNPSSTPFPVPTLEGQSSSLPIPNIDEASQNQLPVPTLNGSAPDQPLPTLDLFGDQSSSSSSSVNNNNNGGGGGTGVDPNYVLYGNQYPYPPNYGPYPPYATTGVYPNGTPILTVGNTSSGAPLSNTGPGIMVAGTLLGMSGFVTLRRASRKRKSVR